MRITELTSRQFNQDTGRAKKAAKEGPVVITDRGRPSHVLLTFEDFEQLSSRTGTIVDKLGMPPGIEEVELEIPPLRDPARAADLR